MKFATSKGFTLIELIVVIAIMSIAYALVAPNLFSTFEKSKAIAERKNAIDLIQAIGYKAFINGKPVTMELNNNKISYHYINDSKKLIKNFEHISFPKQSVIFSSAGFPNVGNININSQSQNFTVNLDELLN